MLHDTFFVTKSMALPPPLIPILIGNMIKKIPTKVNLLLWGFMYLQAGIEF